MRIGVIGINHKLADLKVRDALAIACQKRFKPGFCLHDDHTFILLSTCNRTEIYFCSDDLALTHSYLVAIMRSEVQEEFEQKLYSFFGSDCFHHLCRVASGLDSAIVAETEIQGQVKLAYEHTLKHRLLPHDLHYLFQKALKVGKTLRTQFPLQKGLPKLENAVQQHFNDLEVPLDANILFVGASEINFKLISHFKSKRYHNITLCNRTDAKALQNCQTHNLEFLPWDQLTAQLSNYKAVILGTKADGPIIKKENLQKNSSTLLIIDLGVPRNADPALKEIPNVLLTDIDALNLTLKERTESLSCLIDKAEDFVESSSKNLCRLFLSRQKLSKSFEDSHVAATIC